MWAKKLDEVACRLARTLHYKDLTFPVYQGPLSAEQLRSDRTFYAYYGGRPMTEAQIEREVDGLIKRKLVAA